MADTPFRLRHEPLEGLHQSRIAPHGLPLRHGPAEDEVLYEAQALLLHHLGAGRYYHPVDLGLRGAVGHTALAEQALAEDLGHLGGELLLPFQDEPGEVVLAPRYRGLRPLFLVDGAEEAAEAALHALVRVLPDFFKLSQVLHDSP